jgi:hypothetical protein
MQRVFGEISIPSTTTEDVVNTIKTYEQSLNLNEVPNKLSIRKLGIKVNGSCIVSINGRDFSLNEQEPLEFGYNTIRINSIVFKTTGVSAVVRYMYFREDKMYQ